MHGSAIAAAIIAVATQNHKRSEALSTRSVDSLNAMPALPIVSPATSTKEKVPTDIELSHNTPHSRLNFWKESSPHREVATR